ncbi:MAG: hypothetical protein CMP11_05485 [Zetaproteobacteria bacterium]|nr:hypothetical protein [Pseudobdellovibrionaceae bacterium]|tara:strand:+ start:856 stop:1356 length:501 start_codon:yes stop_codon:yes gene_type:complete
MEKKREGNGVEEQGCVVQQSGEKGEDLSTHKSEPFDSKCSSKEKKLLNLKVSLSFFKKLSEKARFEGVSVEDFARELLSEGLVLRAWEIIEGKNAMRSQNTVRTPRNNFRNSSHSRTKPVGYSNNSQSKQKPGQNQQNRRNHKYSNIMNDSANFIEYVRNQEKVQR